MEQNFDIGGKKYTVLSQTHKTRTIVEEMNRLKDEVLTTVDRLKSYKARAIIYTKDARYYFPLNQVDDQNLARRTVIKIAADKKALFFIIVGLTHSQNQIDSSFSDYYINFIGHFKEKVIYRKYKCMVSDEGKLTVIDVIEDMSSIDASDGIDVVDSVEELLDQETEKDKLIKTSGVVN